MNSSGGDPAFTAFFERHRNQVYAYCRRRTSSETVDDVVAEVFLTAWRRRDDAPDDAEIRPWLFRIAHLTLRNHWRSLGRRRRLQAKLEGIGRSSGVSIPDQIVMRDEVREALALLDRLRAHDREIIKLAIWEELSHAEIAAVLDIDQNAARQRLFRAKKRLTREYERAARSSLATGSLQEGGEQ